MIPGRAALRPDQQSVTSCTIPHVGLVHTARARMQDNKQRKDFLTRHPDDPAAILTQQHLDVRGWVRDTDLRGHISTYLIKIGTAGSSRRAVPESMTMRASNGNDAIRTELSKSEMAEFSS